MTCEHGNPVGDGPFTLDQCYQCWRRARRGLPLAAGVPRRPLCLHLGTRTEFRPGCGGRMCKHACDAGEPFAVPGGNCQTCPKWEPDSPAS